MALTAKREAMSATGYGASEVGTIAGLHKWSTPIAIFEKRVFGKPYEEPSLPAELGLLLEEPLAKKYAADTGAHLARCDTLRHRVQTFALAIATPDRVSFPTRRETRAMVRDQAELDPNACVNVQVKTASMWDRKSWGPNGSDQIPEAYLAQVQWEMAVLGLSVTDVPVLFDRYEYAVFRVPFDARVFEALYEIVARFHRDHVLAGVPPAVDGSEDFKEFLHRRFAQGKKVQLVEPGSPAEAEVLRYGALKAQAKTIENELKVLGNSIRGAIGDGHGLTGTWGTMKWHRKPASSSPNWEAIAREGVPPDVLADLIPKHQKQSAPYDQLRASWSKEVKFTSSEEE